MMLPESTIVAVAAIVLVSTLVRAVFGFGNALVAMPLLVLVVELRVATPVVALLALIMTAVMLARSWRDMHLGSVWRLVVSSAAGIPVGLIFLKGAYEREMTFVMAAVVILFATWSIIKPNWKKIEANWPAYPFGLIAGILGGAYNTNGPPIVMYGSLKKWPAGRFRATLQGHFAVTGILAAAGHASVGLWTSEVLSLTIISLPSLAAGLILGHWLHKFIPERKFDRYVHVLLIALGLGLLTRSICL